MTRKRHAPTTDALEILRRRYVDGRPGMRAALAEARLNVRIAQCLYDLRTAAGLTQKQLAEKAGTSHSVISRLEDADYRGHSLSLLRRVAAALGHEVSVAFVPARRRRAG